MTDRKQNRSIKSKEFELPHHSGRKKYYSISQTFDSFEERDNEEVMK